MTDIYKQLSWTQFYKSESDIEVRVDKSRFGDKIHKGIFADKIEKEFTRKEIKEAIQKGWIARKTIAINGSHRSVYAYIAEELDQVEPTKKFIQKTRDWIRSVFGV